LRLEKLTGEFVNRMATILLMSRDARHDLVAMLYLAKFDLVTLIGCESNSMASVAKALRITRQSFHEKVTRIADTLKLDAKPRI